MVGIIVVGGAVMGCEEVVSIVVGDPVGVTAVVGGAVVGSDALVGGAVVGSDALVGGVVVGWGAFVGGAVVGAEVVVVVVRLMTITSGYGYHPSLSG